MNLASRRIAVRGIGIHCLVAGKDGSFVLLLHGGGMDSASLSWGPVIGPLAAEHCVYAPDWPGYGDSDRPRISYTMSWYVAFLRDLLDVLAIERATLVGVSMGGGIALGFALAWPARVSKLVLVDSYGLQSRTPMHSLGYVLTRLAPLSAASWGLVARSRSMVRSSLAGLFHDAAAISEELLDEVCAEVRKPEAGRAFRSFQRSEMQWGSVAHGVHRSPARDAYPHVDHSWGGRSLGTRLLCSRGPSPGEKLADGADAGVWPLAAARGFRCF